MTKWANIAHNDPMLCQDMIHSTRNNSYIVSFNHHKKPKRKTLLFLFYLWVSEILWYWSKVTWWGNSEESSSWDLTDLRTPSLSLPQPPASGCQAVYLRIKKNESLVKSSHIYSHISEQGHCSLKQRDWI
jgi:hypothetical protein